MSTQLDILKGKKELPTGKFISEYTERELYLTRFYGGKNRGVSLQLTLNDDYIQLDNATVQRLINLLVEAFPSEDEQDDYDYTTQKNFD